MYGEDASGRMVSLLNRGPAPIVSKPPISNNTTSTRQHATIPSNPSPPSNRHLPPLDPSRRYHHPSRQRPRPPSTSPASSSRTPPLIRHDSNSSQSESTISPMTPSYTHDTLDPQNKSMLYFGQSRYNTHLYQGMAPSQHAFAPSQYLPTIDMPIGDSSNGIGVLNQQAFHNLQPPLTYPDPAPSMASLTTASEVQPSHYAHMNSTLSTNSASIAPSQKQYHEKPTSQSAATQTSSASSPTTPASPLAVKKKFPCPHAMRFRCTDTFTTSGHASRHGKKHTGEKSVVCPTCHKAFTRKDNMKQHERTHKNGGTKTRQSSSSSNTSPTSTTHFANSAFAKAMRANGKLRRARAGSEEEDGEGESPGLDALAVAAHMR